MGSILGKENLFPTKTVPIFRSYYQISVMFLFRKKNCNIFMPLLELIKRRNNLISISLSRFKKLELLVFSYSSYNFILLYLLITKHIIKFLLYFFSWEKL